MRAHLYRVITNAAGDIQPATVVRLMVADTLPSDNMLVTVPVYTSKTGPTLAGSTFTVANGIIDVWMDAPQFVMLGLTPPGVAEYFVNNAGVFGLVSGNAFVGDTPPVNPTVGMLWYDTYVFTG